MPDSPDEEGRLPRTIRDWRCDACDYIAHGATRPDECPVCGADAHAFKRASPA